MECLKTIEEFNLQNINGEETYITTVLKNSVAKSACQECYECRRHEEFISALSYLDFDDQIAFLKDRGDCEDVLVRVYEKNDSVVQFFTRKGQYIYAADKALSTNLKAKCLITASWKMLIIEKEEEEEEKVNLAEKLNEVLDLLAPFDETTDFLLIANLLYCSMLLKNKYSKIQDAIRYYEKVENPIGKILCFRYWLSKNPKCIWNRMIGDVIKKMHTLVESTIVLIKDLFYLNANITPMLRDCCKYFGFASDDKNPGFYVVEDQFFLEYILKYASMPHPTKMSMSNIHMYLSSVLLEILHMIVRDFHRVLMFNLEAVSMCQISNSCVYERCGKQHEVPSLNSYENGHKLVISTLQLRGTCENGKATLTNVFDKTRHSELLWLESIVSPSEVVSYVHGFLQSYLPFLHIIKAECIFDFFKSSPSGCGEQLRQCIRHVWNEKTKIVYG